MERSPPAKRGKHEGESEEEFVDVEQVTFEDILDPVTLTSEEQEDFNEIAAQCQHDYDYEVEDMMEEDEVGEEQEDSVSGEQVHSDECDNIYSSDGSCTPSPQSQETLELEGTNSAICKPTEVAQRTEPKNPAILPRPPNTRSTHRPKVRLSLPSHDIFLKFLLHNGELNPTSEWNSYPQKVYSLFNVTTYIVHPNYILASDDFPDNKVSTILTELETLKTSRTQQLPWSYVKRKLKHFMHRFEGFEELANIYHVHNLAHPLIIKFRRHIDGARKSESDPKPGWYSHFISFIKSLGKLGNELTFHEYVSALFTQLNVITDGRFPLRSQKIQLVLPAQRPFQEEKVRDVKPDFMVMTDSSAIMLVGEVKKFGRRGVKYLEHKGRRVKKVQPDVSEVSDSRLTPQTKQDTNQPQGQGDQLPLTVNEKDKSSASGTTDEPHTSIINEQSSSTIDKDSPIPVRPLDAKERYKVNSYLPQLFGQMLAAMHANETDQEKWSFKLCAMHENIIFGFGVEGLKLRFVKLTIIDLQKKMTPTVSALLSRYRQRFKCKIHMTQEFNLVNKRHLDLFYKVLVAMKYVCD